MCLVWYLYSRDKPEYALRHSEDARVGRLYRHKYYHLYNVQSITKPKPSKGVRFKKDVGKMLCNTSLQAASMMLGVVFLYVFCRYCYIYDVLDSNMH